MTYLIRARGHDQRPIQLTAATDAEALRRGDELALEGCEFVAIRDLETGETFGLDLFASIVLKSRRLAG